MAQSLSTINPDFDDLVTQFQNKLASKDGWRDLLATSTGQILIEFIAGVGELDQYAIERIFQEMFPETARLDSSIYGATKMLGVRLGRKLPASTIISYPNTTTSGLKRVDSLAFPLSSSFTIPPYSQFTSDAGLLFNREAILFDAGVAYGYQWDSTGTVKGNITLYEGVVNSRTHPGNGADFFSIISEEEGFSVADTDVVVSVNSLRIPRQTSGLWNNRDGAPGWQDITTSRGQLHVLFGTRVSGGSSAGFGTVPTSGDNISLTYVLTKGALGNTNFNSEYTSCTTFPGLIDGASPAFATSLLGGANQRSAKDYQRLGARLFAADQGERAVTPQDYQAIAATYPGIVDVKIFGQRDTHPTLPSFMNMLKVAAYPKFSSDAAFNDFVSWLSARSMYSVHFFKAPYAYLGVAEPIEIQIDVTATVYCNNLADLNNVRDNYIKPAMLSLMDLQTLPRIGRIGRNLYRSDIINSIKKAHPSIDYVELVTPSVDVWTELEPPTLTVTSANTGSGTLVPGTTYHYWIAITNSNGSTIPIGPYPVTISTGHNSAVLSWTRPPYSYTNQYTSFTVYGRTSGTEGLIQTLTYTAATWTDLGTSAPTTPRPVANGTGAHITLLPATWANNISSKITMAYTDRL